MGEGSADRQQIPPSPSTGGLSSFVNMQLPAPREVYVTLPKEGQGLTPLLTAAYRPINSCFSLDEQSLKQKRFPAETTPGWVQRGSGRGQPWGPVQPQRGPGDPPAEGRACSLPYG